MMPRKIASRSRSTSVPVATGRKERRSLSTNNEVLGVASGMAGRPRRDTSVSKSKSQAPTKKSSTTSQPVVSLMNILHDVATEGRSHDGDRIASRIPNEVPAGRNRGRPLKRGTQPEVNIVPGSEPVQQLQSVRAQGTLVASRARGLKAVVPMTSRRTLQSDVCPLSDPGSGGTSSADRLRQPAMAVPLLQDGPLGDTLGTDKIAYNGCGDGGGRAGRGILQLHYHNVCKMSHYIYA